MIRVPLQWSRRIPVCSRHGNPVTFTAGARFRSRPPAWLLAAMAVVIVIAGLPVAIPGARYLDDPDPELYLLMLGAGLFGGWLAHAIGVKVIDVAAWGFCPDCRTRRTGLAVAATVCFVLVLVSCAAYVPIVLPEQLGDEEPQTAVQVTRWTVLFAPAFFAIAAAVLSAHARWARVAGGVASRDATAVEFRRPAREFRRQMSVQPSPEPA